MNPKMDLYMNPSGQKELYPLDVKSYPLPKSIFEMELLDLVYLMNYICTAEESWFNGASLSQTIGSCYWMSESVLYSLESNFSLNDNCLKYLISVKDDSIQISPLFIPILLKYFVLSSWICIKTLLQIMEIVNIYSVIN